MLSITRPHCSSCQVSRSGCSKIERDGPRRRPSGMARDEVLGVARAVHRAALPESAQELLADGLDQAAVVVGSCASAGRARGRDLARQVVPEYRRRVDGHRRLDRRSGSSSSVHLGMRVESVDISELTRVPDEGDLDDPDELARGLAWNAGELRRGRPRSSSGLGGRENLPTLDCPSSRARNREAGTDILDLNRRPAIYEISGAVSAGDSCEP